MSAAIVVQGSTALDIRVSSGATYHLQSPTGASVSLEVAGGPPGPPGPAGADVAIEAVAAATLAVGTPVVIDRATGQFTAADAAGKPTAFVAGLLTVPVTSGFVGTATPSRLTLADWSAVTGTAQLSRGVPYFLAVGGGLTTVPPASPACITFVGKGLSATTLLIDPQPPIQL